MFIGKEKCVTEKQLSPGTNCFPWAFALKFLAMINENVLGYDLLLAVSNSRSPSVAFFISEASWSRGSITSLLAPSYINVPCWAAFPDPHTRLPFTDPSLIHFQAGKRQLHHWVFVQHLQKDISGVLCRAVLHLRVWTFSFLDLERRSFQTGFS